MRTIQQIYDEMAAFKQTQVPLSALTPNPESGLALLAALSSGSKVAAWRLKLYTVAAGIYVHETLFELFREESAELAEQAPAGTPRWYHEQALKFQYGHLLVYTDYRYCYLIDDAASRIVKRVAVQNRGDGLVLVKAAKLVDGDPVPLDPDELIAFEAYMALIKFAGTRLASISLAADQLQLFYQIYYDPLVPRPLVEAGLQAAVEAHLSNLPFDAALNVTRLTDALQVVPGVKDPVFLSGSVTAIAQPAQNLVREHIPSSGYFELVQPIAATFTFTPKL